MVVPHPNIYPSSQEYSKAPEAPSAVSYLCVCWDVRHARISPPVALIPSNLEAEWEEEGGKK